MATIDVVFIISVFILFGFLIGKNDYEKKKAIEKEEQDQTKAFKKKNFLRIKKSE